MTNESTMNYDGFDHEAADCRKFLYTAGIFTISLANGQVAHHTPRDTDGFRQWLLRHHVQDIRNNMLYRQSIQFAVGQLAIGN